MFDFQIWLNLDDSVLYCTNHTPNTNKSGSFSNMHLFSHAPLNVFKLRCSRASSSHSCLHYPNFHLASGSWSRLGWQCLLRCVKSHLCPEGFSWSTWYKHSFGQVERCPKIPAAEHK